MDAVEKPPVREQLTDLNVGSQPIDTDGAEAGIAHDTAEDVSEAMGDVKGLERVLKYSIAKEYATYDDLYAAFYSRENGAPINMFIPMAFRFLRNWQDKPNTLFVNEGLKLDDPNIGELGGKIPRLIYINTDGVVTTVKLPLSELAANYDGGELPKGAYLAPLLREIAEKQGFDCNIAEFRGEQFDESVFSMLQNYDELMGKKGAES